MDLTKLTIREAHRGLTEGQFSAVELSEACLKRIADSESSLQAFITVTKEEARKRSQDVDKKLKRGEEIGILEGIPYSAKDMFCTRGIQTTAGSRILEGFVPTYNATSIKRIDSAGAIILGKNTQDEFGHGASSENTGFAVPRNPWDTTRVAGGSSGGSAVAVASGGAFFSLGTDTGGSIRLPSSFCGIVGLKPSYGRVSRYGVVAMASSLDTIGCMARSTEDVSYIMKVMAGSDVFDSTTIKQPVPDYPSLLSGDITDLKIGIPKEYFTDEVPKEIIEQIWNSIEVLKKLGATMKEISLPHTKYGVAAYYVICPCEVSANMARYDGIRFGPAKKDAESLLEMYLENRTKFHPEVKRRIMIGTFALSSGYYDAYYLKAQKVRTLIKKDFDKAFNEVDVIVAPTAPCLPFKIGEKANDPLALYLGDVFTIPVSLAGLCSLNMPAGLVSGLPVGFQIIGPQAAEDRVLNVGYRYEKELGRFPMPKMAILDAF